MQASIIVQDLDAPPCLAHMGKPFVDASQNSAITFVLIQGGMKSGAPSVMIVSETSNGPIFLQTSLDKFLSSASGMAAAAESRWGWEIPEGHATIMPMDAKARKQILESIKKELEEWEEESDE